VPFGFLSKETFGNDSTADNAFLIHRADCHREAHVIECKKTINADEWIKAKRQIHSSLVRLAALAGVMDVRITRYVCYTAYREDRLEVRRNADPILFKVPIGGALDPVVEGQLDWFGDSLDLGGFLTGVPHRRLQVDPATCAATCILELMRR
jgi:hypothetical protein